MPCLIASQACFSTGEGRQFVTPDCPGDRFPDRFRGQVAVEHPDEWVSEPAEPPRLMHHVATAATV
jgi:hypothetical protein